MSKNNNTSKTRSRPSNSNEHDGKRPKCELGKKDPSLSPDQTINSSPTTATATVAICQAEEKGIKDKVGPLPGDKNDHDNEHDSDSDSDDGKDHGMASATEPKSLLTAKKNATSTSTDKIEESTETADTETNKTTSHADSITNAKDNQELEMTAAVALTSLTHMKQSSKSKSQSSTPSFSPNPNTSSALCTTSIKTPQNFLQKIAEQNPAQPRGPVSNDRDNSATNSNSKTPDFISRNNVTAAQGQNQMPPLALGPIHNEQSKRNKNTHRARDDSYGSSNDRDRDIERDLHRNRYYQDPIGMQNGSHIQHSHPGGGPGQNKHNPRNLSLVGLQTQMQFQLQQAQAAQVQSRSQGMHGHSRGRHHGHGHGHGHLQSNIPNHNQMHGAGGVGVGGIGSGSGALADRIRGSDSSSQHPLYGSHNLGINHMLLPQSLTVREGGIGSSNSNMNESGNANANVIVNAMVGSSIPMPMHPIASAGGDAGMIGGLGISRSKATRFPVKLMQILSTGNHGSIISWTPDGLSFVVKKPSLLVKNVLPNYFKEVKYSSFTRKLHRWGFIKILRGKELSAYFHKYFRRGNFDLCDLMHCSKGSGSTGGSGSGGLGVDATMSVADVMGMMPRLGSSDGIGMNSGGIGGGGGNANANANATESSSGGIVANAANDHDQENAMSQAISAREVIHAEQMLKEHLVRESRLALNNQSLPRTSSQGLDQNQNQGQGQGQNQGLRRSMDQSQIQGEGNTTAAMQQYFNKSQREQQQQQAQAQAQAQVQTSMGMNMNMGMPLPLPLPLPSQRSNLGVEAGMMRQGPHNPFLNNHRHGHGHGPAHNDRDRNGQGQGHGGHHQQQQQHHQQQQQQQQQMQQDSNHYFTSIPSMNNTAPRFNPLSNRGLGLGNQSMSMSMNPGNNASNLSSFGHGSGMNMNMQVPSIPSSVLGGGGGGSGTGGGGDNNGTGTGTGSGSGGNLNIGRGRSSNQHRRIMEEAWNALSWESKMRAQDAGAGMGMSSRPSRYGFHPDLHY